MQLEWATSTNNTQVTPSLKCIIESMLQGLTSPGTWDNERRQHYVHFVVIINGYSEIMSYVGP